MNDELVAIIDGQTQILFVNAEDTLNAIGEEQLYDTAICDWPLGEQVYHALHSLDQWFINPNSYEEPPVAARKAEAGRLSKTELFNYYRYVRAKIGVYIKKLDDEMLAERPPGCQFTRLALALGQHRHFMYHIGLIHGCLRVHSGGQNPPYTGLGPSIKPVTKKLTGGPPCQR